MLSDLSADHARCWLLLEILHSDSDPEDTLAKVDALNLVPDIIHHSGEQECRNILDLTMNDLNDPDAGVRLTASRLGDTSAIAALQAALAAEQDPNNHRVMLNELKRLKTLEHGKNSHFPCAGDQIVNGRYQAPQACAMWSPR